MFNQEKVDKQDKRLQHRIKNASSDLTKLLADTSLTIHNNESCDLQDELKRCIDDLFEFRSSIAKLKKIIAAEES